MIRSLISARNPIRSSNCISLCKPCNSHSNSGPLFLGGLLLTSLFPALSFLRYALTLPPFRPDLESALLVTPLQTLTILSSRKRIFLSQEIYTLSLERRVEMSSLMRRSFSKSKLFSPMNLKKREGLLLEFRFLFTSVKIKFTIELLSLEFPHCSNFRRTRCSNPTN